MKYHPTHIFFLLLGIATGLLSLPFGLGLAVIGMGFANATASGTGIVIVFAGAWTVFAVRGIRTLRWPTYLGLTLAWLLVTARIIWDFPATGMSLMLALFLVPLISLPLGLAWLLCSITWCAFLWVRTAKLASARQPRLSASRPEHSAEANIDLPPVIEGPVQHSGRRGWVGMAVRLALLIGLGLGMPELVWLDRGAKLDKLAATYGANTSTSKRPPIEWGACTTTFLGYSLTEKIKKDPGNPAAALRIATNAVADAVAEVESLARAAAKYIRVGVSGDQLLTEKPWQEPVDDAFMVRVRGTGRKLVLVDTQHPKVTRDRKLTWPEFADWHLRRIEYYQQRYHPAVYLVVCEPLSYHGFVLQKSEQYSAAAWVQQLSAVCRRIKEIDRETRTGICLLVMNDKKPEWEVWRGMKNLPELDILSVEIYQPEDFALTEQRLQEFGHPRNFGKSFWIAETYNGWALAGDRRWQDDARWVRIADGFAATTEAQTVLVWAFGTFIQGGSFYEFFRGGALANRWREHHELSLVGKTFAELARRPRE